MEEILNAQKVSFGIDSFLEEASKYSKRLSNDININSILESAMAGNIENVFDLNFLKNIFLNEVSVTIELMINVLIIIVIHSIFKAITENLENSTASNVVYLAQYFSIVTVITDTFLIVLDMTKSTISDVISFMNILVPLLISLMITTGSIITGSKVQVILIFIINLIGNFINLFLIPLLLVGITLTIVSNLSEKIQIDKLSKLFKSSIVWILGIILTIFTGVLSIEGNLASSVDGITSKTVKAAVTNFIPVVGKIMGDTVDTVLGCANILKNSIGVIGLVIIIGIVIVPIIKIIVLWFSFKLTVGVCEIIAEPKIIKLIDGIADGYKILLAILISVSIMFVIGITIAINVSNSSIMYK